MGRRRYSLNESRAGPNLGYMFLKALERDARLRLTFHSHHGAPQSGFPAWGASVASELL
jgi:hypothetical protein